MAPSNHRLALLISVTVHLAIVTSLISYARRNAQRTAELPPPAEEVVARRIFLPPPAVLREQMAPPPPPAVQPPPAPQAVATPPPARPLRDRISIGDASSGRTNKPLILRPEDDLTAAVGKPGLPEATPAPGAPGPLIPSTAPVPPAASPAPAPAMGGEAPARSLTSSLRELEQRLAAGGGGAVAGGAARQMGPLLFDPEGADFTSWVNHFKNEVYRNWIVPQSALFGFRGHVDIVFSVGRDGSIRALQVQKSSGTPALDRAAVNALRGGRFLALPADYGPPEVTMEVTFFYGEGPVG